MSESSKPKNPVAAGSPTPESPVQGAKAAETQPPERIAANAPAALGSVETGAGLGAAPKITEPNPNELARWNDQVLRRMRSQTRRSFVVGGAAILAGWAGWHWLHTRREDGGVSWPLRRALDVNEQLARDYFRSKRLAPDFHGKAPLEDRVNGDLGLEDPIDVEAWRLSVEGLAGRPEPLNLALDDIRKLPRVEMTTEFKCIEGWSAVMQWEGVRFTDFMAAYPPQTQSGDPLDIENSPEDLPPYVGMATPDSTYYVGLDMESMLHPQSLLAYEINGAPLSDEHGAPLRLVTPVKYGVKNLKRIGTIRYSRARPADYWAEEGYDWYIGL